MHDMLHKACAAYINLFKKASAGKLTNTSEATHYIHTSTFPAYATAKTSYSA